MKSLAKRSDKKLAIGASGSGENLVKSGSGWSIGVRAIFCQGRGGGAVDHLPKNFRKLPKFLRSSRKETRVI